MVIDVLRATTTIVHALGAGASEVLPCQEVKEARELAARSKGLVLLGGERRGLPIHGFDLGNSPAEYTAERVADRTIVMTTTNGTRSLIYCTGASQVIIGAFVNLTAVCLALAHETNIHLLCAGTRNEITREDVLLAGAIVDRLHAENMESRECNDQAAIAREAWQAEARDLAAKSQLNRALRNTRGGRNLLAIGQQADIEIAAEIDKFDIVPRLDRADWAIRVP